MSDNEIIKALTYCVNYKDSHCENCPYRENEKGIYCVRYLAQNSLDLINRLKAENERLNFLLNDAYENNRGLVELLEVIKAEAYKEFAKRLEEQYPIKERYRNDTKMVIQNFRDTIDNLLKELVK